MTKIFILGTDHRSPVDATLKGVIEKKGIQAIIKEAVKNKGEYTHKNFILEPIIYIFAYIYFRPSGGNAEDWISLSEFSKECKIDFHDDVDATLTQLVEHIHNPLNYLIAFGIIIALLAPLNFGVFGLISYLNQIKGLNMFILLLMALGSTLAELILIGFALLGYSEFMLLRPKTMNFRNECMVSNAIAKIKVKNYKCVIFSCGEWHTKKISKLFIKQGYEVEPLVGYQHGLPYIIMHTISNDKLYLLRIVLSFFSNKSASSRALDHTGVI